MSTSSQVPGLRKRGRPTADERRARETEILTAALVWIALPLAIGAWRIRRNEVK